MNIFFTEHVRATASTSNADAKKNHTKCDIIDLLMVFTFEQKN